MRPTASRFCCSNPAIAAEIIAGVSIGGTRLNPSIEIGDALMSYYTRPSYSRRSGSTALLPCDALAVPGSSGTVPHSLNGCFCAMAVELLRYTFMQERGLTFPEIALI